MGHYFRTLSNTGYRLPLLVLAAIAAFLANTVPAAAADDYTAEERQRLEEYRLSPMPSQLETMRHVHPRILLNAERAAELRQLITTTHKAIWEETKRQADRAVESGPPEYTGNGDGEGRWGFEQLWQRNVGNYMTTLAMAWLMTEDRKYLDSAREWALASCSYRTWGGLGYADGVDLAASHQLLGLALIYDWCYDALDEGTKTTIRETLVKRTSKMAWTCVTDTVWWHRADSETRIWYQWQNSYMQNHLWVNMCGVAFSGLAIYDEVGEAECWIGLSLDKIGTALDSFGADGASHEGVQYWDYGVENLLKFMHAARDLLGVDLFGNEWMRHTADYRLYLSLPLNAWAGYSNVVDIGDCSRGSWYSDYNLRALAGEYRDSHAQWLANAVDDGMENSPRLRCLSLLWYDPSVRAEAPGGLPTLHHFSDMEIVSARSGWSGDESLVVFKCGPYIGHKAVMELPYDASSAQHVHPDTGNFIVFGGGECLIRDDGYSCKWADQHNTLLVDGSGQTGEGGIFFDGSLVHGRADQPRIVRTETSAAFDLMSGDATAAYPESSGLKRFVRHLLYLKPDVLIVADDIACDGVRDLELRFHPEQDNAEMNGAAFMFRGRKVLLRLDPLTLDRVDSGFEITNLEHDSGFLEPLPAVRLKKRADSWRNAVAFSWTDNGSSPARVTVDKIGDVWTFTVDSRTVTLNWETGEAVLR